MYMIMSLYFNTVYYLMLRRVVKSSIRYMFCSRNNNDQYKDYDHVFVNQDKIKKKMEEIKRRKNQSGM